MILWDVATGERILGPLYGSIERNPNILIVQVLWGINSLTFSADGERIIAGMRYRWISPIWDVATGERVQEHPGNNLLMFLTGSMPQHSILMGLLWPRGWKMDLSRYTM